MFTILLDNRGYNVTRETKKFANVKGKRLIDKLRCLQVYTHGTIAD